MSPRPGSSLPYRCGIGKKRISAGAGYEEHMAETKLPATKEKETSPDLASGRAFCVQSVPLGQREQTIC
jgi:hypothetical protein